MNMKFASVDLHTYGAHYRAAFSVYVHFTPGRPSMDILVRSWQDLAKILEKSWLRS